MKVFLLASVAAIALFAPGTGLRAADMAVKAPPPPYIPPQFNWTGFYIGGNVGAGAATATVDNVFGAAIGDIGGRAEFIGGGQIGYNWQFSPNWVFGVDWFFDGIANNNNGGVIFFSPAVGDFITASARADWVTTITARIGITGPTADHWMWYTKGGGGWLQTQASVLDLGPNFPGSGGSVTHTNGGWVWGTGIEWAFAQNWTWRIEYQYLGLNSITTPGLLVSPVHTHDANFQSVTIGLNWLFNYGQVAAAPVVSRY